MDQSKFLTICEREISLARIARDGDLYHRWLSVKKWVRKCGHLYGSAGWQEFREQLALIIEENDRPTRYPAVNAHRAERNIFYRRVAGLAA